MNQQLTVKEACNLVGKSESTIKRIVRQKFRATQVLNKEDDFVLCCDEVTRYLGHDQIDGLATDRHLGLSHWLAVQDLSGLRNKQVDLLPKVLSQCSIICSFRQTNPEDVETLGRLHAQPGVDFTKLTQPTHDGYDWYTVEEKSFSRNVTKGTSNGITEGDSFTQTRGISSGRSFSETNGETLGLTQGDSWGKSESEGKTREKSIRGHPKFKPSTRQLSKQVSIIPFS